MRLCGMVNLMEDASPALINSAALDSLVHDSKSSYLRKVPRMKPRL